MGRSTEHDQDRVDNINRAIEKRLNDFSFKQGPANPATSPIQMNPAVLAALLATVKASVTLTPEGLGNLLAEVSPDVADKVFKLTDFSGLNEALPKGSPAKGPNGKPVGQVAANSSGTIANAVVEILNNAPDVAGDSRSTGNPGDQNGTPSAKSEAKPVPDPNSQIVSSQPWVRAPERGAARNYTPVAFPNQSISQSQGVPSAGTPATASQTGGLSPTEKRLSQQFAQMVQAVGRGIQQRRQVRAAVGTSLGSFEAKTKASHREPATISADSGSSAPRVASGVRANLAPTTPATNDIIKAQAALAAMENKKISMAPAPKAQAGVTVAPKEAPPKTDAQAPAAPQNQVVYATVYLPMPKSIPATTPVEIGLSGDFGDLGEGDSGTLLDSTEPEAFLSESEEVPTVAPTTPKTITTMAGPLMDPALWALGMVGALGWIATASPKKRSRRRFSLHASSSKEAAAPSGEIFQDWPRQPRGAKARMPFSIGFPKQEFSKTPFKVALGFAWSATFGFAAYVVSLVLRRRTTPLIVSSSEKNEPKY